MKKELIVKELVKIAKELIAEQYSVSDITKKDWDRAMDLLKKPIGAATSMSKLTKQPKKLFARAACLYALSNKLAQVQEIQRERNNLYYPIKYNGKYHSYEDASFVYERAEELLENAYNFKNKAKKIKLQNISYGKSICKQLNDFIKELQDDIEKFPSLREERQSKRSQLNKQLKQIKQNIYDKSKEILILGRLDDTQKRQTRPGWTKDWMNEKQRKFNINSIPDNVYWAYRKYEKYIGGKELRRFLMSNEDINFSINMLVYVYKIPKGLYEDYLKIEKEIEAL